MILDDINEFRIGYDPNLRPNEFYRVDVADQILADDADTWPGIDSFVTADELAGELAAPVTLTEVQDAINAMYADRIATWSAIDDLERLALRDDRDMVVHHRDGVVEDAFVIPYWRSEEPRVFLLDLDTVDLPLAGRAVFEWPAPAGPGLVTRALR